MQLNDGRVIPNFMCQALRGENLTVYGDGSQTRSFCYVSDEIDGILRLARSSEHEPVNIGNPNEFTILECARKVIEVTGSSSTIQFEPLPQDDPKQRCPDISKARRLLGLGTEGGFGDWPEVVAGVFPESGAGTKARCRLARQFVERGPAASTASRRRTSSFSTSSLKTKRTPIPKPGWTASTWPLIFNFHLDRANHDFHPVAWPVSGDGIST